MIAYYNNNNHDSKHNNNNNNNNDNDTVAIQQMKHMWRSPLSMITQEIFTYRDRCFDLYFFMQCIVLYCMDVFVCIFFTYGLYVNMYLR